jgi:transcriptional regulator GlxA family with amidase domain
MHSFESTALNVTPGAAEIARAAIAEATAIEPEVGETGDGETLHRLRSAVTEILTALHETLRNDRIKAAECLQRAGAMLDIVERRAGALSPTPTRQGLAPWQVRRVLLYIDANLESRIRNKHLAAVARLSEFYFNVAFRNSVGRSPHDYVIRRRVERAQGLMLSTDRTLAEIAAECGLADQAHFTRLFRKVVGDSPAAWRRARENPLENFGP